MFEVFAYKKDTYRKSFQLEFTERKDAIEYLNELVDELDGETFRFAIKELQRKNE